MGRRGVKLRFPPKLAYLDPESNQETFRGPLQIPLLPRAKFRNGFETSVTRQFFFHQYVDPRVTFSPCYLIISKHFSL